MPANAATPTEGEGAGDSVESRDQKRRVSVAGDAVGVKERLLQPAEESASAVADVAQAQQQQPRQRKRQVSSSVSRTHSHSRSTITVVRRRIQRRLWPSSQRDLAAYPDHNHVLGQRRMKRLDTLSHVELLILQALAARARQRHDKGSDIHGGVLWRSHPFLTRQRDVLVSVLAGNDAEMARTLLRDLQPPLPTNDTPGTTSTAPMNLPVDGKLKKALQMDYPVWRKVYFQTPIDQRLALTRSAFLRLFPVLQRLPHAAQKRVFAVFDRNGSGKVEFTELCESLVRCSNKLPRRRRSDENGSATDTDTDTDDDRITLVFEWFMDKHEIKLTRDGLKLLDTTLRAMQTATTTFSTNVTSKALSDALLPGSQSFVGFDDFYDRLRTLPQVVEMLMAPFEILAPLLDESVIFQLHGSTPWVAGDAAYVVDASWWKRWLGTVTCKPLNSASASYQEHQNRSAEVDPSVAVGPITNASLCQADVEGVLKPGLRLHDDFVLVSSTVWQKLQLLYGGGPELPRKVVVNETHVQDEEENDADKNQVPARMDGCVAVGDRLQVHLYPLVIYIRLMKTDSIETSLLLARRFLLPAHTLLKDLLHRIGLAPGVNTQSVSLWVRHRRWDVWRRIERSLDDPSASLEGVRIQSGCELTIDFKASGVAPTTRQLFADNRLFFSLNQPIGNDFVSREPGIECALSPSNWHAQQQSMPADQSGNRFERQSHADDHAGEMYAGGHTGLITNSGMFVNLSEGLKFSKKPLPRLVANEVDATSTGRTGGRGGGVRTTGLLNMGNTCFLNCALQCVSHSPVLREYFLSQRFLEDVNKVNPLGTKGKIATAYGKLMDALWSELKAPQSCFAPAGFRDEFACHRSQFQESSQHDAHEFMVSLLDSLHEDLNRKRGEMSTPGRRRTSGDNGLLCLPFCGSDSSAELPDDHAIDSIGATEDDSASAASSTDQLAGSTAWQAHTRVNSSVVVDLFHGQIRSETVCSACDERKTAFDPFLFVSVPIPEPKFLRVEAKVILQVRLQASGSLRMVPPTRQGFWLARTGTVADLCVEIAQEYGLEARRFVVVEVRHNRIKRIFGDTETLEAITPFRDLYAYERAWGIDDIPTIPSCVKAAVASSTNAEDGESHQEICGFSDLRVGSRVDGVGFHADWHPGSVVGISEGRPDSEQTKTVPGTVNRVLVHFDAFSSKWDKWFSAQDWLDGNIGPVHFKTTRSVEVFEVQVVHRRMTARPKMVYSNSTPAAAVRAYNSNASSMLEVFGVPMFVTIASDRTADELHGAILLQASRFIPGFEDDQVTTETENSERVERVVPYDVRIVDLDDVSAVLGESLPNDASCILQHFATQSVIVLDWKSTNVYADTEQQANDRIPEEMVALEKEHASGNGANESILSNSTSLTSCLEALFKPEEISLDDHWMCERCGVQRAGTRRSDVWRLPDLVMIQLKRFQYQENGFRQKVRTMVDFPLHGLDFSQWMGKEGSGNTHDGADDPACVYDLYAVANHVGGLARGHYTAYCKYDSDFEESARLFSSRERDRHHRGGAAELQCDDLWFRFDDDKVVEIAPMDVVTEAAYVLFYKRRELSPHNVMAYAM